MSLRRDARLVGRAEARTDWLGVVCAHEAGDNKLGGDMSAHALRFTRVSRDAAKLDDWSDIEGRCGKSATGTDAWERATCTTVVGFFRSPILDRQEWPDAMPRSVECSSECWRTYRHL